MRNLWLILIMIVALSVPRAIVAQASAITVGRTDSIWSPTLREWRRFQIYVPPVSGGTPMIPAAYPVLYLLDGPTHFHSVTGVIQFFSTGGNGNFVLPEMIVVSIPNTNRTRDLTPTRPTPAADGTPTPAFVTSGGGSNFLQFVRSELIPHIDSTFRTEPFRVLVGHSFGGITAIHALYTMPDVFNAYVAIDPSLWWDSRTLLTKANAYFAHTPLTAKTLFVAQANTVNLAANDLETPCGGLSRRAECPDTGNTAHFRAISDFNKVLQSSSASGLRYGFRYYPNDDHGSVPLIATYDALRFIFDGYKVDLGKDPTAVAVAAQYSALSSRLGYPTHPSEKLLTSMAGAAQSDSARALSITRYYLQLYPQSAKAHDVMGGALLSARDTVAARAAYEQALLLDPQNQRIRDLVANLRPH